MGGSQTGFEDFIFMRRGKFIAKFLVKAATQFDELTLVKSLRDAQRALYEIYENVYIHRNDSAFSEVVSDLMNFINAFRELDFMLDSIFIKVNGDDHIEINTAKRYIDKIIDKCTEILAILENDKFSNTLFGADLSKRDIARELVHLRKVFTLISEQILKVNWIRRTQDEESELWERAFGLNKQEEESETEHVKGLLDTYFTRFYQNDEISKIGSSPYVMPSLQNEINNVHSRVMAAIPEFLKPIGATRNKEKMRSMHTKIRSFLMKNKLSYGAMSQNQTYQDWRNLIEEIAKHTKVY